MKEAVDGPIIALSQLTCLSIYLQGYDPATVLGASIEMWYNEEKLYNYDNPGATDFEKIGHFTQLVWASTTTVGCGKATCSKGSPFSGGTWQYVVCRYSPAGNVIGSGADPYMYFKLNVRKPTKRGGRSVDVALSEHGSSGSGEVVIGPPVTN